MKYGTQESEINKSTASGKGEKKRRKKAIKTTLGKIGHQQRRYEQK